MSYTTDIAFSDSVKSVQSRLGSRDAMERLERSDSWPDRMDHELAAAIAAADSLFLASASSQGQPYVQHRGGEPGFIEQRDERTLVIPDYGGNRHYVSLGNFLENPRCCILLVDFRRARRYKLWGEVVIEALDGPDRRLVFTLTTWDRNCPNYLPRRYAEEELRREKQRLEWRIEALEAELRALGD